MEAERRATYADLLKVPDRFVAELVGGVLHTSPRPAPRHAHVSATLGQDVGTPFARGRGGPGGWRILDEPELHLGDDVLVPDLAGWRLETLPELPETAYFAVRPDWICEILSPSNARFDRLVKMDRYALAGIPWAWLVDPIERYLEVYELQNGAWVKRGGALDEHDARLPPFDAVPLDVGALWP
jgi:Uma2 family endonuclease